MGEVVRLPGGTVTLQVAVDAFLDHQDLARSTRRVYRTSLASLVAELGPATAVGELPGPRVAGWFRARHATAAPATWNRELATLRAAVGWWRRHGWLAVDPTGDLQRRREQVDRTRALTRGQLACFPLFWWDHMLTLLGTGLRFGELAGLRRRRVHLNRPMPVLEVGSTRYQAGRFGSGFKPRPKSDAGIRQVPLAPLVVEAIRRQLPPGSDPDDLVFTGPGGGPGRAGGSSVSRGTRTVLSRHNLHRTYQGAVAKLADPAVPLRPTARRVLRALRDGGPQSVGQLAARLAADGSRSIRLTTVAVALRELHAASLVAVDDQDVTAGRWSAVPIAPDPLLEAVDLHGAHDFRHTYATWLEDAGIPARVIDELMGHEASGRSRQHQGSAMGAHYRHTTPEMAARAVDAIQQRLTAVLQMAEHTIEKCPDRATLREVF
jgi:integrase